MLKEIPIVHDNPLLPSVLYTVYRNPYIPKPRCLSRFLRNQRSRLQGNGLKGWENAGSQIDEGLGKPVTVGGWPIRWVKGDGSIVRLVAIVDEGDP